MTEREVVLAWLEGERLGHQEIKYSGELRAHDDVMMAREGLHRSGFWWEEINRYFHRAMVLGLETPGGRQAAAKGVATAIAALESVLRVYGPLPEPGVPSGEVREWVV